MKSFFFTTFLFCLLCISCRKEAALPKTTDEGKNTFGCKIDGALFVPEKTITYPTTSPLATYYDARTGYLELRVSEDTDEANGRLQRYFSIKVSNLATGSNALNEANKAQVVVSRLDQLDKHYETNSATGGTLTISRLDTAAHIIAGTFSFQAALRPDNSSVVRVTEGRFDVTYTP